MSNMSELHQDCLFKILEQLNIVDLTLMKQTSKSLLNYVNLFINKYMEYLDFSQLPEYVQQSLSEDLIESILDKSPSLKVLNFIPFDGSIKFDVNLQNLKVLGLKETDINEKTLSQLAQRNHHLESVDMFNCLSICDEILDFFVENNKNMKRVNVGLHSTYDEYNFVSDKSICNLASVCTQLTHINMACRPITEKSILAFAENCKELKSLIVPECSVTGEALCKIAESCSQLRVLNVSNCFINDEAVIALSKFCKELIDVNIFRCNIVSDSAIEALINGCPRLQVFKANANMTHNSVQILCSKSKDLTKLYLVGEKVTDESLKLLANSCSKLTHVYLSLCYNITDEAKEELKEKGIAVEDFIDESDYYDDPWDHSDDYSSGDYYSDDFGDDPYRMYEQDDMDGGNWIDGRFYYAEDYEDDFPWGF